MKAMKPLVLGLAVTLLLSGCGRGSASGPAPAETAVTPSAVALAAASTNTTFSDVPANAWYAADVAYVAQQGLMDALHGDIFAPEQAAPRGVIVEALWRSVDRPGADQRAGFTDVPTGSAYAAAVDWATQAGVTNGDGEGHFMPDTSVTRQDFAVMLWRAVERPFSDVVPTFDDFVDTASYAQQAVAWANANGIINGKPGNLFDPTGTVTRAEVSAILHRYLEGRKATEPAESVLTLTINGKGVEVAWEDNPSVEALRELAARGPITVAMSPYGGFEQVGSLGQSLVRNDVQTTTAPGDIVLYSGNQMVIFHGSNSWAYTRLGHIQGKTQEELKALLGGAGVTAVLSVEKSSATTASAGPVVYFTSDISPQGLAAVYGKLNWNPAGKVAVKVSTGEPPASNYLRPELIGDLVKSVNGTIVECNTAYGGSRASSAMHRQVAADHGFTSIAGFDLMDEEGEVSWPVTGGDRLDHILVGSHAENYPDWLILSHYKGHAMAGFGGAIKNVGIGASSASGKVLVHTAGTRTTGSINYSDQDAWLEALAEMVDGFVDHVGAEHIVYVNVMNRLSVDCDCNGHPAEPDIHDIGILASTDPVALDQACYDLVAKAEGNTSLMNRIQRQNGLHTLEHAEEIGLGSRSYTLVQVG